MTATTEERVTSVEQRVSRVEVGLSDVKSEVKELREEVDGLPEKFSQIIDDKNLLYLKNFGRRSVRILGGTMLMGVGALISELIKMWLGT